MIEQLVSIIIPTYNRYHIIRDTLNSIQKQTYSNWECIVVDDGSEDATEELMQDYIAKDNRFKFSKRPESMPKGANACRNYGFKLSKGEFINWFDSDDIMLPQKLELQIESLTKNQSAPYCICQSFWFDRTTNTSLGLRAKKITSDSRFEDYISGHNFWLTTAPLWRAEFINKHNLSFDETLHQSQEYDFHIKALSINDDYSIIEEPLVTIVRHDEALSHNILEDEKKVKSNIKVKMMILEKYRHKLSSKGKVKVLEFMTLMFKDLLKEKKVKLAFKVMKDVLKMLKYMDVSFIRKAKFSFKLVTAYASYCIFGRGYNVVKPLT